MAIGGFGRVLDWTDYNEVDVQPASDAPNAPKLDCQSDIRIVHGAEVSANPMGSFGIINLNVTILIRRKTSWVLSGKQTSALLKHEQTHYNIGSIAARQLERTLMNVVGKSYKEAVDNYNSAADTLDAHLKAVQLRYDEDPKVGTAHGADAKKQLVWNHAAAMTLAKHRGLLSDLP